MKKLSFLGMEIEISNYAYGFVTGLILAFLYTPAILSLKPVVYLLDLNDLPLLEKCIKNIMLYDIYIAVCLIANAIGTRLDRLKNGTKN